MEGKEDLFEVVVSGVGGKFPMSEHIEELRANLNNKVNMVTDHNCRWNKGKRVRESRLVKKINSIQYSPVVF